LKEKAEGRAFRELIGTPFPTRTDVIAELVLEEKADLTRSTLKAAIRPVDLQDRTGSPCSAAQAFKKKGRPAPG